MKTDLDKLETSLEGLKNLRVEHSKQCPGCLTVTDITTGEQLDCIEPLLIGRYVEEDEAFTEAVAAACTNIFALIAELRELREDATRARWCEENTADVVYLLHARLWMVSWNHDDLGSDKSTGIDRNAAIDAARGKV